MGDGNPNGDGESESGGEDIEEDSGSGEEKVREEQTEDAGEGGGNNHEKNQNMTDDDTTDIDEEFREEFKRQQLIDKKTDKALDLTLRMNPIDVILKNIDEEVDIPEDHRDTAERAQGQMQEWLEMYEGMLRESKGVPRDLIRRSAELANDPLQEEYEG